VLGENLAKCHSVYHKFQIDGSGLNLGLCGKWPVTNHGSAMVYYNNYFFKISNDLLAQWFYINLYLYPLLCMGNFYDISGM
jgi:hypothetical protein